MILFKILILTSFPNFLQPLFWIKKTVQKYDLRKKQFKKMIEFIRTSKIRY